MNDLDNKHVALHPLLLTNFKWLELLKIELSNHLKSHLINYINRRDHSKSRVILQLTTKKCLVDAIDYLQL